MHRRPMSGVTRRMAVAFVAVIVAIPLIAARADAFLYWSYSGSTGGQIGRTNTLNSSVVPTFMTGLAGAQAVAVDSQNIYWANGPAAIGKATLDGTVVDPSFVTPPDGTDSFSANALAVDPVNGYLFWADRNGSRIGRADLADGKGVNLSLISTTGLATGVVTDGPRKTVYWTVNAQAGAGVIGRANEDGSGVQPRWLTNLSGAQGITSDGTSLYWANGPYQIGQVSLGGIGLIPDYVLARLQTPSGSAVNTPVPIVVGGSHIYYASLASGYIGQVPNVGHSYDAQNYFLSVGSATGLAFDTLASPGPILPPTIPDVNLLKADVERIELSRGIERSLLAQLTAYGRALDAGDQALACDRLADYAHHVDALTGKKIPAAPAALLLADARAIARTLGCPPTS